ncbi:MAG: META domain-containing protein [Fusobacteriaceae bacterium]
MKKIFTLALLTLTMILTGCTALSGKSSLEGKTYTMVAPYVNSELTLSFQDGQIAGFAGVNRFFGPYKLKGENLELGALGMTRMAGPLPEMQKEDFVISIFNEAKTLVTQGEFITITAKDGKSLKYKIKK